MILKFTSPMPPSVNDYLGKKVAQMGRASYVQVYETTKAREYKKYMQKLIKRAIEQCGWIKPGKDTYVVVEGTFYMERRRKDIDNHWKCLLDSIVESGVVEDDDIIIPVPVNIFIDSENPRIEIKVYIAPKVGIFKDCEEYGTFVDKNCMSCNRFNKNCSILRKSLENRIQNEINIANMTCDKLKPVKSN
ncbi:MAG: RusA family crossover junction endodeoxyribonuclease [Bacilli bacterium]|uniref:RusA family crossover junction endodeoxyribonuclease n=1 Tax=Clostridium sp. TaxID=1506 RepID=UPI002FC8039F